MTSRQTKPHPSRDKTPGTTTARRERKSISPLTNKSSKLQKTPSNLNTISQKRLPVMAPSKLQVAASKHQRTTTLYKSTVSATAKQKTFNATARESLVRDVSAKSFKKQPDFGNKEP